MMRIGSALLGVLVLLAGCGGISQGGSAATELTGRTFLSTAVKGHTLAAGSRISLSFPERGKIAVQGGCNHLFGTVVDEPGDKLVIKEMGGTDMACADQARMDQDTWLTAFLTSKPVMVVSGSDLTLTSGDTEMTLTDRKVADPDRKLTGTKWVVDTLMQSDTASSVPQGTEAHLTFTDDGKVTGNTGCNQLTGTAKQSGDKIVFANIATTKMVCPGAANELEKAVLAVLDGEVTMKIDANRLTLKHASGKGLQLSTT
jgi:heat shock protein HslJ